MRRAARVDVNQTAIVAALQAAGATVEVIGLPLDLLVARGGKWAFVEIKSSASEAKRKTKTRRRQLDFERRHPNGGPVFTVWDVDGALAALRAMADSSWPQ